ncbi:MAG TPA: beta-galactosidase [Candidatus Limnocylindrales bacterium]|nr:beta-galactosidase [Candidatus Limnocylindrales bacterium]
MTYTRRLRLYSTKLTKSLIKAFRGYYQRSWWHKLLVAICVSLLVFVAGMYGFFRWYAASQASKPLITGTSFIPAYAESFGLDAKDTMDALIGDLGVRQFRLVSYWNQLEPSEGTYDFSLLDWQFEKAEASGSKVTLSLGLRQPRWPECHMPDWAKDMQESQWQPKLEAFMAATVNRYKDSPALDSYQVENEFFLMGFGICTNHNRDRLVSEYNLVKKLDPHHKVIIARSNNAQGWPVGEPTPDEFGVSIYKRVWDAKLTKRYLEYPFPAWYYGSLAGWQKLMTGRDMIIHELQAEAWPPNYQSIQETPLAEQNKSFNAQIFENRIEYGKATGMREIYLWGSEYWYYRKQKLNDPSLWNVAKTEFHNDQSND